MALTALLCTTLGQVSTEASDASLVARWGRSDPGADSNGMLVRSILKREMLVDLILRNEPSLQLPFGPGVDIYQFGVFTGGGMKGWV
eukprot:CAMPEP_0185301366 /NCGR_PEP_ID=MMETSP1363-20130426/12697_1 /TAXON_ID=38817 /ORGANISM="Gephyrocapsa oceanica, Strain RCC1303" /LENGTH=86 /DNA_ID=CAMNT_0027898389 /DNA_START=16 /DNA_END=273 /DNA_ORIENTATION=+